MEWPTGQERRAWLDRKGQAALDAIQYYLGPGVNVGGIATIADALNPIGDMTRAGTAARGAVQPGLTASERAGYVGSALTDMASVLAPVAGAAYADDAARGLTEGLANLTMPADDAAARFFVDEDGAIRAWHGSPHDFDRFSMDKIGTGEGAQAYGHGLYFAENERVARNYRDALSDAPEIYKLKGGDRAAALEQTRTNLRNLEDRIAEVMQKPDTPSRRSILAGWLRQKETNLEALRLLEENEAFGRLYEVNIDANPEDFLDWDAPLSAQPESVRQILEPLLPNPDAIPADEWGVSLARARAMQFPQNPTGGDFIRQIPELTGEDLERSLREAGIPGIRYLDAGSRGAGDGSRNYVVFDDRLVDILGKDGQRTTPQGKAQDVLDLLTSGRASEVTDDMLDLGDPVLNAQLNEYLYRNYDLPMDEASRMARAREMGFHDADLYHATPNDFQGFDLNASGFNTTIGDQERAVFMSDRPEGAASFINRGYVADFQPFDGLNTLDDARARYLEIDKTQGERAAKEWWANEVVPRAPTYQDYADGGNVMPLKIRTDNGFSSWNFYGRGYDSDQAVESILDAKAEGSDAVVWNNIVDGGFMGGHKKQNVVAHFDPTQVRSRFARFDPRLAHLRNLSAGLGGIASLPILEEQMRAYLESLPES